MIIKSEMQKKDGILLNVIAHFSWESISIYNKEINITT